PVRRLAGDSGQDGDGADRSVGLRQVDLPADDEPHERHHPRHPRDRPDRHGRRGHQRQEDRPGSAARPGRH
ncbi:hypothetical protein LTR94_037819, partial [Friedmanniomyces endolithicus]